MWDATEVGVSCVKSLVLFCFVFVCVYVFITVLKFLQMLIEDAGIT